MIEEIKLLLPLLEGVADGSMWLVGVFLGFKFVKLFTVVGVFVYIVSVIARLISNQSEGYKIANSIREKVCGRDSAHGNFLMGEKRKIYEAIDSIEGVEK